MLEQMDRRQFVAGAAAVVASPAIGQIPRARSWLRVQALIDQYITERRFAGVATAIAEGTADPSFVQAGSLAFRSNTAIDPDSLFRLYSVTKPLTGIAAMLLVEDGRIALDQPVADALPEFGAMQVAVDPDHGLDARPATRQMTVRHLLTHTSGLSNWQPLLGDPPITRAYRERGITPGSFVHQPGQDSYAEQVDGLAAMVTALAEIPLIAEPGTAWHYSMGLDVMGAVIERVTGMSLGDFMQQRIFGPLDMRSTGFQAAASDAQRFTTLYANPRTRELCRRRSTSKLQQAIGRDGHRSQDVQ